MVETKIRVRYPEVDRMGVVHHAVYPIWYELAREDFLASIIMTPSRLEKEKEIVLPIVHLHAHYYAPILPEDELRVQVQLTKLTAKRMELSYKITKADGSVCHKGETEHAFADTKDFKAMDLSQTHPEIYQLLSKEISDVE